MSMAAAQPSPVMPSVMIRFEADQSALLRTFRLPQSRIRHERMVKFYSDFERELSAMDFAAMGAEDRADWVLLRDRARSERESLEFGAQRFAEARALLPYWDDLCAFHEERISKRTANGAGSADRLTELTKAVGEASRNLADVPEPVARRAYMALGEGIRALDDWYDHFAGYDPLFTWWTERPNKDAVAALNRHRELMEAKWPAFRNADGTAIVGDPVGEAALKRDLAREYIPYTPQELIAIGERELAWCDAELARAAQEMGVKTWQEAMELVKQRHVAPGEQPQMVWDLANEAVEYLEKHSLVTIPELAKETWRLNMMPPERQLVAPFFLGGETIMVSFPTNTMTHAQKEMSLRANNIHFARATVHHELIPGHHLQQFMNSRHSTHRSGVTGTPFWTEGWALYWEFLFYKQGFITTPEDRVGFLFWRRHRAVRIIFSLKYHLGQMTEDECVRMLIDVAGHEPATAEGEVRRSFNGDYPPLYQVAYMIGAVQMQDIRRELVDSGRMSERDFHDAILKLNNMPWAMVRALLSGAKIEKDFRADWRFDQGRPVGDTFGARGG
ncbi:MAG TPA: DUF885 family protein [Fimbriimonadaceae bacterium]|nr:DUF885 family protein [Fimbriimonadaceae bacterium]HRE94701.1 DUF885 family protein [Fimbriimonadaceae bacterium]